MEALLVTLESSALASAMRSSHFLYPLANVIHILAALTFFASVAAMDVKLLRASSIGEARVFMAQIRPWAAIALVNVIVVEMLIRGGDDNARSAAKGSALVSLGLWLSVAAGGRLIAYF
jgi:hypothetical protein